MVDVSDPLPPSPPDLDDRYVAMHNDDWDVYRNASGRLYYHDPVAGKSRWKPPRKNSVNAAVTIPRTVNSVRAFEGHGVRPRRYLTVRRDSPRFSDFETPDGYKEVYDDDSGLISYVDQWSGAQWFTNQDSDANVYFYARIDGQLKSVWRLPDVLKSRRQDVMHAFNFSLITEHDADASGSDSCQQLSKAFANCSPATQPSADLCPPSPVTSRRPLLSSPTRFKRVEELFAEFRRLPPNKENKEQPHRRREGSEPPTPREPTKLQRNGLLTKSFRIMAETVQLRPKNVDSLSVTARLERTPSKRIQLLSRLMERRAKNKDKLIKQGILRHEAVFGNHLEELPKHVDEENPMSLENGLPDFVVRCVKKIETAINLPGLYRTNGNSSQVQKIRCDVDNHEYKSFDDCTDVATLTSTLKLFFRELPDPLIPKECRDKLCSVACVGGGGGGVTSDKARAIKIIEDAFDQMVPLDLQILHYLLLQMKRVANHPGNLMSSNALSIVVAPNLVHGVADARRPESVISEIELNNAIVERLIEYAVDIFE